MRARLLLDLQLVEHLLSAALDGSGPAGDR
jgi:hypothetical protein